MNPFLIFLLGTLTGATGIGFLGLVMHLRMTENMKNYHLNKLNTAKTRAYANGYRDRSFQGSMIQTRV